MIRINDDYVINANDDCYMLQQDMHTTYKDKKGVECKKYKTIGYYTTLCKALEGAKELFARKLISANEMDVAQAWRKVQNISEQFERMKNND